MADNSTGPAPQSLLTATLNSAMIFGARQVEFSGLIFRPGIAKGGGGGRAGGHGAAAEQGRGWRTPMGCAGLGWAAGVDACHGWHSWATGPFPGIGNWLFARSALACPGEHPGRITMARPRGRLHGPGGIDEAARFADHALLWL